MAEALRSVPEPDEGGQEPAGDATAGNQPPVPDVFGGREDDYGVGPVGDGVCGPAQIDPRLTEEKFKVGKRFILAGMNQSDALLRRVFLAEARVLDKNLGYISVSPFNLRMRPEVLKAAASLVAGRFKKQPIDVIHGIPHSGNYLATAVTLAFGNGVRLHTSRKDQFVPMAWKDVFRREVRSFTANREGGAMFSGISLSFVLPKEKVLVVDDVCATGQTGVEIVKGLKKLGVDVVGFAVLFDKVFQGGLARVEGLGVKVFSCVRVKAISREGRIELME